MVDDPIRYFGNEPHNLKATLGRMADEAEDKSQFNQADARRLMAQWVSEDNRLRGYVPERLVDKVMECRGNGSRFDLNDPYLLGGSPRPLSDRGYR
jgi:hypothetical protein